MCGNNLGKRLILFSITFALGVLAVNFFVSNKLPEQSKLPAQKIERTEIEQKPVSSEFKNMRVTGENCFPVETKLKKSIKSELRSGRLADLIKQKRELQNRLRTNRDVSVKERIELKRRLEVIETEIFLLKTLNEDFEDISNTSQTLLYVEECYEF